MEAARRVEFDNTMIVITAKLQWLRKKTIMHFYSLMFNDRGKKSYLKSTNHITPE